MLDYNQQKHSDAKILLLDCLINIGAEEISKTEFNDEDLLQKLITNIFEKSTFSDKCCMALNNITRQSDVCKALLKLKTKKDEYVIDELLDVFCEILDANKCSCNLDHLASVLVNITQIKEGRLLKGFQSFQCNNIL